MNYPKLAYIMHKTILLLIITTISILCVIATPLDNTCIGKNPIVKSTLKLLYMETNGTNWNGNNYLRALGSKMWHKTDNYCSWTGVVCLPYQMEPCDEVVQLLMDGFGLHGYLPGNLGDLHHLRILDLSNNPKLIGEMHRGTLLSMNKLAVLNLSNTGLSGPIPIMPIPCKLETINLDNTRITTLYTTDCPSLTNVSIKGTPMIPRGTYEIPFSRMIPLCIIIAMFVMCIAKSRERKCPFDKLE